MTLLSINTISCAEDGKVTATSSVDVSVVDHMSAMTETKIGRIQRHLGVLPVKYCGKPCTFRTKAGTRVFDWTGPPEYRNASGPEGWTFAFEDL